MRNLGITLAAITLALVALAAPVLAAPGDMNVATFLAKADALEKKGAMALFSSDIKLLKDEGNSAGTAYKARLARERKAGQPSSCPPKGTKIDSDKLLAHLRSYPGAQRASVSMKTAFADMMIKAYPCR